MNKRIIAAALAAVLIVCCFALTACHKKEQSKAPTESAQRYDSLDEIKNELGFDITVPEDINGIVALSTCAYEYDNARYVVVCVPVMTD